MLPDGRRLGAHLPLGAGMLKAVERARDIGADAIQIFADNPTAWRRRAEPPEEQAAFAKRLAALGIGPTSIHGPYLINLAGPDPDFFARSVAILAHDLRLAPGYGARFVNIHIGSHRGVGLEAGIRRLADGVRLVLAEVDDSPVAARLVLENSAGGGFGIGATVDELAQISDALARAGIPDRRVAFCLDAAHAWGAGVDVGNPAETDRFLADFGDRVGLERLVMVHFNDTRSALGSRTDRHEHIGAGMIGTVGLAHLLLHPALGHAVYYLETPGMDEGYDAVNLERTRDLAAGRSLPELPPEALLVGSARSRTAPADTNPEAAGVAQAGRGKRDRSSSRASSLSGVLPEPE